MLALAEALEAAGFDAESVQWLQRAASPEFESAPAMVKLGQVRMRQHQFAPASMLFKRAMELAPNDPDAAFHHGMAELNRFQMALAIPSLQRAIQIRPKRVEAHVAIGRAHELLGTFESALSAFERANDLDDSLDVAIAGRVRCLIAMRRESEAEALIDDANVSSQSHPDLIDQLARMQLKRKDPAPAISIVRDALERAGLHPSDRSALQFAYARLLEADNRHEAAFSAYEAANRLYPGEFDREAWSDMDQRVRAVFDHRRIQQIPRAMNDSQRPVFIVGMPRSGTSLVEQILAAHPSIAGGGELESIGRMRRAFCRDATSELAYPEIIRDLDQSMLEQHAQSYLAELCEIDPDALRVTDKMPSNYRFLGIVWMLFSNARIIHCRRDPVDTCLSCYTTSLPPSHGYASDLGDLAYVYAEYQRMMDFWMGTLDLDVLDVAYEDLVGDTDASIRRIVSFCDVPWDDACLSFYEQHRPIATASVDQASRPIYRSSVGRATRFGANILPLRDALAYHLATPDPAGTPRA